jgi:hypothetical protein
MLANTEIGNPRGTIIYFSIENGWLLWLILETEHYGEPFLLKNVTEKIFSVTFFFSRWGHLLLSDA